MGRYPPFLAEGKKQEDTDGFVTASVSSPPCRPMLKQGTDASSPRIMIREDEGGGTVS